MLFPVTVHAATTEEQTAETYSAEDIQKDLLEEFQFSDIDGMIDDIFPRGKWTFTELVEGLISGDVDLTFDLLKEFVTDQFFYELDTSRSGLIHILLLVIIAAVFSNFSKMFKSTQVSEISFFMLYMMLITITLTNFRILAEAVTANLGRLLEFMKLLGPIYFLAVGISTGSSTSITFYQVVLLLIFLVEMLILNFLVPLAQLYLIMRILGEMSPELPLTKFSELLETIISWSLKTLMAGIIGLNLIQGLISPAIDTVKRSFLTKTGEALPIVGDVIGGTTEIVLGTAVLIKNGIGVAGMVLCFVICLAPLLQMAITTLLYQLVAALIQPISDKRMVNCVSSMADSSKVLLKILSTTMVLFLLTIAVVSSTTGG
jgi:stage III sporulation protein AE